jgi:hypothetical protein
MRSSSFGEATACYRGDPTELTERLLTAAAIPAVTSTMIVAVDAGW